MPHWPACVRSHLMFSRPEFTQSSATLRFDAGFQQMYIVPSTPSPDHDEPALSLRMIDSGFTQGTITPPPEAADKLEGLEEFFDLKPPAATISITRVEELMQLLFSEDHLHFILENYGLFQTFSSFLNHFKPCLVPTLVRYLEMRKALKAAEYANSVAKAIRWPSHTDFCKFSMVQAAVVDVRFEDYVKKELGLLCSEALPAFITHTVADLVVNMMGNDITGQGVPALQELVRNLAEVFCLTDPSLPDNPIIYASEEFHRSTQYGTTYAIDKNCRFLQGPCTDKNTTKRIAESAVNGRESNELILNYRRDGTPFVNLLMSAPLHDDKGVVRYFLGAQVDVTALIEEGRGIESFSRLLQRDKHKTPTQDNNFSKYKPQQQNSYLEKKSKDALDTLQELGAMFNQTECEVVIKNGKICDDLSDTISIRSTVPTSIKSRNQSKGIISSMSNNDSSRTAISHHNHSFPSPRSSSIPGVYTNYLLVRPYPSLQITFVSPALRLPGLLRTHLFSKIGGPPSTMSALERAFRDGASVTAKVLWLPKKMNNEEQPGRTPLVGKQRWVRCTPLLGSDDRVGIWMVVVVVAPVESELPSPSHEFSKNPPSHSDVKVEVDVKAEVEAEVKVDAKVEVKVEAEKRQTNSRASGHRKETDLQVEDGGFGLRRRRVWSKETGDLEF